MDPANPTAPPPISVPTAPAVEDHPTTPPPSTPTPPVPPPPATTPPPPQPPPPPPPAAPPPAPKSKAKIIAAIASVIVLAIGTFVGVNLARNRQLLDKEAAGPARCVQTAGSGCTCTASGASCNAPGGGSVYKFVCNGEVGECTDTASEQGPEQFFDTSNTACDRTVQIDAFAENNCRPGGPGTQWICGDPVGHAIWYSGDCEPGPSPTPPTSGGSLLQASCSAGISGTGVPSGVTLVHLYFDSGPEDWTGTGGDGHAAKKDAVVTNGSFNYSLLDSNNLIIPKETGGSVNLGDGQPHRVRAFAIDNITNPELSGGNVDFTLEGRILGRIWRTNSTLYNDPNKQLTKHPSHTYNLAVCTNALPLSRSITLDSTPNITVNECNTGGPLFDEDVPMGTHSLTLSSGTQETVGWTCFSDNGVGCGAASGTGYSMSTSAATCAPLHIHFFVSPNAPTPTPTNTPTPTVTPTGTLTPTVTPSPTPPPQQIAECQQIIVQNISRGGTAVVDPSLAKIQRGDTVTFRGFASAQNTTVDAIRFTYKIGANAATNQEVAATLVGTLYQADFTQTISATGNYQLTIAPVSP